MPLMFLKFAHVFPPTPQRITPFVNNSRGHGKTFKIFCGSARALAITNFSSKWGSERNVSAGVPKPAPEAGALPDQSRGALSFAAGFTER